MLITLTGYEKEGWLYSQTHPTLPLSIWNYSDKTQWEQKWDEITLMSRGLVVDNNGTIVARPFKKFFNLSENRTNTSDNFEIFEKLDGSLGILFNYNDEWIFASRGSFTSEQAIRGKELLDNVCSYKFLDENNTYCFEIIYPENKIVVDYNELKTVVLTGVFNTHTGKELSLDIWDLPYVKSFTNIHLPKEQLHLNIKNNEEGYVLKFCNGERCKIKGAEYLRLHKTMSEMSTTAIWECLKNGDSVLNLIEGYPDEWYQLVKDYEEKLKTSFEFLKIKIELKFQLSMIFNRYSDNKTYALNISDSPYKHFFFSLRNGKDITEQIWKSIKPEYKRI